jgi:hypothetical protein
MLSAPGTLPHDQLTAASLVSTGSPLLLKKWWDILSAASLALSLAVLTGSGNQWRRPR